MDDLEQQVNTKKENRKTTMSDETEIRAARRERDMILAPNEYAFISDETKGEVNAFVGPNKTSLAGTDRPVVFDLKSKRFKTCDLATSTQTFQTAPEGWYVILKNPAEGDKTPGGSGKLTTPNLRVGKKVNISGPASFALWPGQMAKVIQGHNLRSNEYLLIRVYDEEAAKKNWNKAVIKTQTDAPSTADTPSDTKPGRKASPVLPTRSTAVDIPSVDDLTMGKLFVIRGTEVSFYIPSTGLEVVPEKVNGEERYVREAVTLERLEYCLLLDQNGNKRYVHGPDVVFPRPTEKFVDAPIKSNPDKARAKKFRAQELTPNSGMHIRVIADYVDDTGKQRKAGEELFVTGKEQTIYFPREEHAIIKYGEQDIHYGIAIPAGEARYVLDRDTGVISLVKGPQIFLPDPRTQVVAQRALDLKLCSLLYPGNDDALAINAERLGITDQDFIGAGGANAAFLNSSYVRGTEDENYGAVAAVATPEGARRGFMIKGSSKSLPGDAFDRKNKFTAPRSIVLNTKFDGAVSTTIWTGYAMLLISKSGERRVVHGPGTFMLEYDEAPQVITLSRGKPKTMDDPLKTVFLLTTANKVSDVVEVETKDFCRLNVKVSYRVNFEGNSDRWFNVDNYVKFLCDHMRSRIRNAVQKLGVEEFYGNHTEILRDVILGASPGKGEARPGTAFVENGMRIYDVEVLGATMQNADVEKLLVNAQREVIQNTLLLAGERRKLSYIQESELVKRQVEEARAETSRATYQLQADNTKLKLQLDLVVIEANAKTEAERMAKELDATNARAKVTAVQLQGQNEAEQQRIAIAAQNQELELKKLEAQVQALVEKAKAVSPDLVAALNSFGERAMIEKVSEAMAPLSILGGGSVVDVMKKLLEGTTLAKQLEPVMNGVPGSSKPTPARA
jgi:major vault protein